MALTTAQLDALTDAEFARREAIRTANDRYHEHAGTSNASRVLSMTLGRIEAQYRRKCESIRAA